MIIKMTVNDNDFDLSNFCKKFLLYLTCEGYGLPLNEYCAMTQEELLKYKKNLELLNPNLDKKLSEPDKQYLISEVHRVFNIWVDKILNFSEEDVTKYLKKSFKVEIINRMTDKWENGEMYYWFQHSNTFLCQ